ncbi:MAG TPA: 2-dehydropantoate 2-reductase N-terminal domain-containing protein, partial [Anaerolineae bacterium]
MSPLKIMVIGAGAMGSLFGGRLALAGHQVTLIDVWQDHIDAINSRGLTLNLV